MSIILQTRDNKIVVVPRSLLSYYDVFDSLEEAVGVIDDVVPIPLTSEQVDIWLDLTIRMNTGWLYEKRTTYDILPCLKRSDVEVIVWSMDVKNSDWMLYCVVDEEEEGLREWYQEL